MNRFVALSVVWSAYLLTYVLRLGVSALAPFLKDVFLLSNAQVGGLTAASAIAAIPMLVLGGWIVDRLGVRGALLAGIAATGSCAAGVVLAPTFAALLGVIALSGVSTGLIYPSAVKAILLWFPAGERGTAVGVNQTAVNAGGAISAIAMPPIAIAYGWRAGFVLVGLAAIAAGIVAYALYADPTPSRSTLGDRAADHDRATTNDTQPPRSMLAVAMSRRMLLAGCGALLISAVQFTTIAHLVLYLENSWAYSVVAAGSLLALCQTVGIAAKPASGLASDRLLGGRRVPALVALCLVASVGCALLAVDALSSTWLLSVALVAVGAGAGGWAGLSGVLAGEIGGHKAGIAAGATAAFGSLGVVVGPPLFGVVVDWTGSYSPAWWMLSAAATTASVLFALVCEESRRDTLEPARRTTPSSA